MRTSSRINNTLITILIRTSPEKIERAQNLVINYVNHCCLNLYSDYIIVDKATKESE